MGYYFPKANGNLKPATEAILMSEKADFKQKSEKRHTEGYFLSMKDTIDNYL
jgi:hypothetical protein